MKRVVNGKAYNTATAEMIAKAEGTYEKRHQGPEWRYHTVLYRTQKGAWFTFEEEWIDDDDVAEDERDVRTEFKAMTLDRAIEWVKQSQCELLNESYFPATTIEEA